MEKKIPCVESLESSNPNEMKCDDGEGVRVFPSSPRCACDSNEVLNVENDQEDTEIFAISRILAISDSRNFLKDFSTFCKIEISFKKLRQSKIAKIRENRGK
jgi:hypothetical protein